MEKRYRIRFPLDRPLLWRTAQHSGSGATVNMSSNGLLIATADATPRVGAKIELAMDWPVELRGSVSLQMRITGRVVRRCYRQFAVTYSAYEYRTRARVPLVRQVEQVEVRA